MPNFLQFWSPSGENVTFTLTAATAGQDPPFEATFTTASGATLYLKIFETGNSANPIEDYDTMEQGKLYDVEAYSSPTFDLGTEVNVSVWDGEGIEFVGYNFVADRRPMYVVGYATSNMSGSEITFGTGNSSTKRKTPLTSASDADFLDPAQNGRINWINGDAASAISYGFERVNYSNIAGWTSVSGGNSDWPALAGNYQPHFPSNPYTGLSLTEATYMANDTTTVGAVTWDTPFTVGGYSNDDTANKGVTDTTPGDQKKAWAAAVAHTKDLITTEGGTPEVIAYCGYRPLWTDKTQTAFDKTLLGYSRQSTGNQTAWDGLDPNSPGWSPEPGWDGVGGTSSSSETFSSWFDEEAAGLYSLGFDSIGLDTGAWVWKNSAGMSKGAAGCEFTNDYDAFDGDDRLIEVFNGYGMKPYFESVPLDRWTHMTSYDKTKLVPMTGNDGVAYTKAAYWALFGSWWGYVGDGGFNEFNDTLTGWSASGGSVFNPMQTDGGATVGDPNLAGAGKFAANTEVHCVVRWGNDETNSVLALTDGWLKLRQMLYDFHDAGIIVSASANAVDPHHGVTAADFYQYVQDLADGTITSRPQPPATPVQTLVWTGNGTGGVAGAPVASGVNVLSRYNTNHALVTNGGTFRLVFGDELETNGDYSDLYDSTSNAGGAGEQVFANTTEDGVAYLNNYRFRIRKDAGAWTEANIPFTTGGAATWYNNVNSSQAAWQAFTMGNDTSEYTIEVYLRSDLDNDEFPD